MDFLKSFYGSLQLDPENIHPSLFQTLQNIDEEDGKDNIFFSHKPKLLSERNSTCKHKEDIVQKYDSCESRFDNGDQEISPTPTLVSQ